MRIFEISTGDFFDKKTIVNNNINNHQFRFVKIAVNRNCNNTVAVSNRKPKNIRAMLLNIKHLTDHFMCDIAHKSTLEHHSKSYA